MKRSITSNFSTRQYMLAEQFEVFYYEDVNLNHVLAHQHDYYELYFFLEGNVNYEIDGCLYPLQYGDFLLIPPGLPHRPKFSAFGTPYRRFVLWISNTFIDNLTSKCKELKYCFSYVSKQKKYCFRMDCVTFQDLQSRLILLIEETNSDRFCHDMEAGLLLASFLVCVNRIIFNETHQQDHTVEKELYLNLCNYIGGHLQENLALDSLAELFYVSKYHISHVFKENMGISLHQYIIKKRLQASKNAILSGIPINKVCQQSGFCDYTSFFRAFKKEFGVSPKEFVEVHKIN